MNYGPITQAFKPSIILSEAYFPFIGRRGIFAEAMEQIANIDFFQNVEISHIDDDSERRHIKKIVDDNGLSLTYWMTLFMFQKKLSLSTSDKLLRIKTVQLMKDHMVQAAECGASFFAVGSGPDPNPDMRDIATEQFYKSLCQLCQIATSLGTIKVLVEPMDRGAHKNCLIGPTAEFVALIKKIRNDHLNIGICWDSAHINLCDDDMFESLAASKGLICQIHLSNAILDRASPDFGDYHMPIGLPGFLTVETIAEIFQKGLSLGILGDRRPGIAVEVRTKKGDDPWANVVQCASILQQAWNIVKLQEID